MLSRTATRKAMQSVGSLLPATLLTLFAVSPPEDVNEAVALLTVCFAALGLQGAGFGGNHADISPRYAGAIFGVTNAMASICGTLGIYLTGILLEVTDGDWAPTFAIIAVTYVAGWAFFMAWGSGEEQDFNRL
uniref:Major facilitator superfamily (MFS) profile domain-containing protein n=1 Tax=Tetraselmis chuii TaxID=63592 RepID=A0A7S1X5V3_9CHLO